MLVKISVSCNTMLCSPVKVGQGFGGARNLRLQGYRESQASRSLLAVCFMLASCSAFSLTMKVEVTCSSNILVDFHWITWRYISGERTLHNYSCENPIS